MPTKNQTKHYLKMTKTECFDCPFCESWFWLESNLQTHCLFHHGFLVPSCQTRSEKKFSKQMIESYALRKIGKKLKGNYRKTLRLRKVNLYRSYFKKFTRLSNL